MCGDKKFPKMAINAKSVNGPSVNVRSGNPAKHLRMNFAGCRDYDTLEAAKIEAKNLPPNRFVERLDNSHIDTTSRLREVNTSSNIGGLSVTHKNSSRAKIQTRL